MAPVREPMAARPSPGMIPYVKVPIPKESRAPVRPVMMVPRHPPKRARSSGLGFGLGIGLGFLV